MSDGARRASVAPAAGNGSAPSLAGRRALVTGAASGIGLSIAERLAWQGASVVLTDLPGERLEQARAGIPGATAIAADLSDRVSVAQLAAEAADVQILVNNAGFQSVSTIEEFDDASWERMLAVMLTAPFLLTKRFLPAMYDGGWGRVINIASVHGLVASPFKAAYVAAKHGLVGLTKTTALEASLRGGDVTAHAVCPSYVRTPLIEAQVADQDFFAARKTVWLFVADALAIDKRPAQRSIVYDAGLSIRMDEADVRGRDGRIRDGDGVVVGAPQGDIERVQRIGLIRPVREKDVEPPICHACRPSPYSYDCAMWRTLNAIVAVSRASAQKRRRGGRQEASSRWRMCATLVVDFSRKSP